MLAAVGFFSLMDTAMKLLSAHYPAMQVAALRGLSSLPLVCAYVAWRGAFGTLLKMRWPLHLLRAGLGILMLSLFAYALRLLPLTEAFRHGEASAIAPFEYTALAWGMGLDWLLWRTLPDHYTLLGAAIIIASGVYLIRREKIHVASEHP